MTVAWIEHGSLEVTRDELTHRVMTLLPPEVMPRVQNVMAWSTSGGAVVFELGDGPDQVNEHDLRSLITALDPDGDRHLAQRQPEHVPDSPPLPRLGPETPEDGAWPCQQSPIADIPPRLLAFLYVLLRDGAAAPGDVEHHAINAGRSPRGTKYTNPHIERYARSLGDFLLKEDHA